MIALCRVQLQEVAEADEGTIESLGIGNQLLLLASLTDTDE